MSNPVSGDLYGYIVGSDLGPDYYEFAVHLVFMRGFTDWLIEQSCFFVVVPMPDNMFTVIVKREMQFLIQRELKVQEGLLKEALDED